MLGIINKHNAFNQGVVRNLFFQDRTLGHISMHSPGQGGVQSFCFHAPHNISATREKVHTCSSKAELI